VIGEWFESYEEAWSYFLTRETPLEDFWSELPEPDRSILAGWLIEPPPQLKDAVRDLLARLGKSNALLQFPSTSCTSGSTPSRMTRPASV
jgi:hypothetical protein